MSYKKYSLRSTSKQIVERPTAEQLRQRAKDRKRYNRNKQHTYTEIKNRGGCQFCHVILSDPVYEWYHIDDDDKDKKVISEIVNRASIKALDNEMSKCVCLCPTCHTTFHQDLSCMIDHRYRPDIACCTHVDGEYFDPDTFNPVQPSPLEKLFQP